MSQISDDIFLGPVYAPGQRDFNAPSSPQPGFGPMGRVHVLDVVPVTAAASLLAVPQAATGGAVILAAGAGVTTRIAANQSSVELVLDTPRNVTLTAAGANTQVATVRGFDQYGQFMSEAFAAPSTSTVTGNKAFKVISSITFAATPGSNVSATIGEKLGFPAAIRDPAYVATVKWDATLADNAATVVVAVGTAATPSTGDVRGTVTPSSASNGTRRLVAVLALTGLQVGPNATRIGLLGVDQA